MKQKIEYEEIELARVFRKGKQIGIEVNDLEHNRFELLAFLECYVKKLKQNTIEEFKLY